ncbi:uroporphyrinogen decarboxylase family protein [Anaerobacillus sp. MEB173]|uniref:uroporphyrinogen decarboxylase family protein n=1 Tax=Anaerobacillus sp. MEB173 TaxID=3383345 RepID=UPI003F8FAE99
MNSIERVVGAVTFQQIDRIPVIPLSLSHGSIVLGKQLPDYQKSGQLLAQGQMKLLDMWEHDAVIGVPHVVEDLVPWGIPLNYYPNGSPTMGKIAIRTFSEIKDLKVPDPTNSLETRETLKAISILSKEVGSHTPVIGALIAPFSLPSMLMGTGEWMKLLLDDEQSREKYLDLLLHKCKNFAVSWAKHQVEAGAHIIVIADGMASQSVISRELFAKYALPIIKETIKEISVPVVYEAVGSVEGIIDLVATTGAVCVTLDYKDDLANCMKKVQGKIAIMGNLNNIEMLYWNPTKMRLEVRKSIEKAAAKSGYILSSQAPEIPYDVPLNVIETMIKATKEFGVCHR